VRKPLIFGLCDAVDNETNGWLYMFSVACSAGLLACEFLGRPRPMSDECSRRETRLEPAGEDARATKHIPQGAFGGGS